MDLRQLRCFLAVAEELHFGRAATRLHIAGPAVSQTIRTLEQDLGLTLFERTNRRVALTEAGHLLRTEAQAVMDRFDAAQATMARLRTGDGGHVRIGAVPALPPRLVPSLLARFAVHAPGLNVVVRALPPARDARELLEVTDVDIVLVRGEVNALGIGATVVATEAVGIALPRSHFLASRSAIAAAELTDVALIAFARGSDPGQYDRIFDTLRAAGLADPRIVHESHQGAVESSLRLVESGVGVSLKLQSEVDVFASPDVVWRPLADVAIDVLVTAAWRRDRTTPALSRLLPHLTAPAEDDLPAQPTAGYP
jgi:DNA-binding transcriptional LysR family regulator